MVQDSTVGSEALHGDCIAWCRSPRIPAGNPSARIVVVVVVPSAGFAAHATQTRLQGLDLGLRTRHQGIHLGSFGNVLGGCKTDENSVHFVSVRRPAFRSIMICAVSALKVSGRVTMAGPWHGDPGEKRPCEGWDLQMVPIRSRGWGLP